MAKKPFARIMEALGRIERVVCRVDDMLPRLLAGSGSDLHSDRKVIRVYAEAKMPTWAAAADHQAAVREATHALADELIKCGAVGRHTALRPDRCGSDAQIYVHRVFVDAVVPKEGQHGI